MITVNQEKSIGIFFLILGIIFLSISLSYDLGSLSNMGPGFFPTILSGILIIFGIYQLLLNGDMISVGVRIPGLLLLCLLISSLIFKITGIIPATIFLIVASYRLISEFKVKELMYLVMFFTVCILLMKMFFSNMVPLW